MAKKKVRQNMPAKKKDNSRSELEHSYIVSRKILRHFDLDPGLIDIFSKKQKERLLHKFYINPQIKPAKERTVPRQYVNNINTTIFHYMKTSFWGDPENCLSYMDLATYGLSFLSNRPVVDLSKDYPEKAFVSDDADNNAMDSSDMRDTLDMDHFLKIARMAIQRSK